MAERKRTTRATTKLTEMSAVDPDKREPFDEGDALTLEEEAAPQAARGLQEEELRQELPAESGPFLRLVKLMEISHRQARQDTLDREDRMRQENDAREERNRQREEKARQEAVAREERMLQALEAMGTRSVEATTLQIQVK